MQHKVEDEARIDMVEADIRAILHAADSIVSYGGRTMLAKILKGSREKKLLQHGLDDNIAYGFYRSLTIAQITDRVDWMIEQGFLEIQFSGELPILFFTDRGWIIQRDQMADFLLQQWNGWAEKGTAALDMTYLKDRNRGMVLLFLQKIAATGNVKYIPLLERWENVDYQKVRQAIRKVIEHLRNHGKGALMLEGAPEEDIVAALTVMPIEPERLKCWECGKRFNWTTDEQKFFRMRGWDPPKRCSPCRQKHKRM